MIILIFMLANYCKFPYEIIQLIGYNIFFIGGYCYYKKISKISLIVLACASLVGIIALIYMNEPFIPMQNHKFPPDLLFISYNIFVICILSILLSEISIPKIKLFDYWNKRGYTLYLYQNLSFFLYFPAFKLYRECR